MALRSVHLLSSSPPILLHAQPLNVLYIQHQYGQLLYSITFPLSFKDLRSPGLKPSLPSPLILPLVQVYYDSTLCSSAYWPEWLRGVLACDQATVACWRCLSPDTVLWPQAPASNNGSLCQAAGGRISSRMFIVSCRKRARRSCRLIWIWRVGTKMGKRSLGIWWGENSLILITFFYSVEAFTPVILMVIWKCIWVDVDWKELQLICILHPFCGCARTKLSGFWRWPLELLHYRCWQKLKHRAWIIKTCTCGLAGCNFWSIPILQQLNRE